MLGKEYGCHIEPSHFFGEWADLAAAVTFRFSMINAINLVVFLHK